MAQKTDIAAEKARKQKIVLAVAGVLLVGLAAIQVPKLMKGDKAPAAEVAPAAAATPTATPTTAAAVTTTTVAVTGKPAAFVAGVGLPATHVPAPAKSQLASFTLFAGGDPFEQQASDSTAADAASAAPSKPAADSALPQPTASQDDGSSASSGSGSGSSARAQPPINYATIMVEGNPQQLQVKDTFPKGDPMFVLVSLKKKQAKIGVAGGAFDDGQTVTLVLGKKVTLLNTATGVRYVLKLVYTGSQPEVIEGFTTKSDQPPAAPADGGSASSTVSAIPTTTTP